MQITLPKPPKIKSYDDKHAVFEIEDIYPGYGVTLGNAIRRALYSSIPGAAITQVKIKGAPHEFSTIRGVKEDVLEITLNLKQVYFKLHSDEGQTASIKAKGPKRITANDIVCPSQLTVANPDAHIATLTGKDTDFQMEFQVEPGLGYIPIEQQKRERVEIGTIPLDAIFTPIKKVNFEVENMRVGDRTDYNRLTIEVETNGTVSPQEAFEHASSILVEHFKIVSRFEKKKEKSVKKPTASKKTAKKKIKAEPKSKPKAKPKAKSSKKTAKKKSVGKAKK